MNRIDITETELRALRQRVGRLRDTGALRAMADAYRAAGDAHGAAVARGAYCPECQWHHERAYARCAVSDAIQVDLTQAWKARQAALRAHWKTCPTCQTVEREWDHLDSCTYANRLGEARRIYVRRLEYLEAKAEHGTCSEPGCRRPVFAFTDAGATLRLCYTHLRKRTGGIA